MKRPKALRRRCDANVETSSGRVVGCRYRGRYPIGTLRVCAVHLRRIAGRPL